ncbi:hypothetical protein GEMRC1_002434 [Eukaryota sp. GEM-RC1]
MTLVTSICWAPRGIAAEQPSLENISDTELEDLRKLVNQTSVDQNTDSPSSDTSDDEVPSDTIGGMYYNSNTDDPYLTANVSDDDEIHDMKIPANSYILLAGRVNMPERDGFLEQWTVNPGDQDHPSEVDMHHDRVLRSAPLCVEWMGCGFVEDKPHLAAVGFMDPGIEIWNLNEIDALEPVAILGPKKHLAISKKRMMKKRPSKGKVKESGHKGAVLNLSWNTQRQQILASGGDDGNVLVWDVNSYIEPVFKFPSSIRHSKPVQTVDWLPCSESIVMSSSFDRNVQIVDLRSNPVNSIRFKIDSDAESAAWQSLGNSLDSSKVLIGCEDGSITCFDPRQPDRRLFVIDGHKKSAIIATHPRIPSILVSGGGDKTVKTWKIDGEPTLLHKENVTENVGEVFAVKFNQYADDAHSGYLAVGGSKGDVEVFDVFGWKGVFECFKR